MIKIDKINELFIKVICEKDIRMEIYEKFSFFVPGYKFMKKYKYGIWDGKIRLYDLKQNRFPLGLLGYLLKMAKDNQWKVSIDKSLKLTSFESDLEKFQDIVFPNLLLEPYDYQVETFIKSITLNRSLVLSPTRITESHLLSTLLFVFY